MYLHLIRHGDTQGTENRLYYGKTDLPLSPNGITNLQENALKGRYPSLEQVALYSTGLVRTEQTLALIYGDASHGTLAQLQEINFGIFEMESHETLQHRDDYQAWISNEFVANVPPQGESYLQFSARIVTALQTLIAQGEDAIVVCHGGTISAIMDHIFPEPKHNTYHWVPTPGHGYTIDLNGDTPTYQSIPTFE